MSDISTFLRDQGDIDLENGDYVVLESRCIRIDSYCDSVVHEILLTFSGIEIDRVRLIHADDA